eukprot:NODE_76_length_23341_cov_0.477498.p9 type:complete len:142 gc:universal NODE_76_length_23341_cov_0.477498:21977-22402(+)
MMLSGAVSSLKIPGKDDDLLSRTLIMYLKYLSVFSMNSSAFKSLNLDIYRIPKDLQYLSGRSNIKEMPFKNLGFKGKLSTALFNILSSLNFWIKGWLTHKGSRKIAIKQVAKSNGSEFRRIGKHLLSSKSLSNSLTLESLI